MWPMTAENAEVTDLRRWFSNDSDIRNDVDVAEEVLAFIGQASALAGPHHAALTPLVVVGSA